MKRTIQTTLGSAIAVLSVFVLFVPQAKADVNAIRSSDNAIWASVGDSFLNYKETIPAPDLPDSERGILPSVAGGVSALTNGGLYLALEGDVSFGNAGYNGALQSTPTTLLQDNTHEMITNVDGKIGKGLPIGGAVMLIPYVEVGYRYWDRNLGGGYVEDYQNFDTLGGLMLQVAPTKNIILSVYGSGGTTLSPQMRTDGYTYDLQDAGMYKMGGKIGFDLTQRIELFTTVDYEHLRYGQSPFLYDANYGEYFNEPSSSTEDTTMRVGLAYHFR